LSLLQAQETKQKDSDDCCEDEAGADHEAVMWLHPQMKSSSNNSIAAIPDLELTLSVSKGKAKTMEQTKSTPGSFLLGPISVT